MERTMCSFVQQSHLGPFPMEQRDSSFMYKNDVSVAPEGLYQNSNFVNNHPHIGNTCLIQQPVMTSCHSDIRNEVGSQSSTKNDSLLNSSHNILDTPNEHHMDVAENSQTEGSCKRKASPSLLNEDNHKKPLEIDMDPVDYVTTSDTQMSPNKQKMSDLSISDVNISGELSDNEDTSDGENAQASAHNCEVFTREKQLSITDSEDDSIVFESSTSNVNISGELSDNEDTSDEEDAQASAHNSQVFIREEQLSISDSEDDFIVFESSTSIVNISGELSDNEDTSDEEDAQASPHSSQVFTDSEDDFIVFESGIDDELVFDKDEDSEEETDSDDENNSVEEDLDSLSSVIPRKRVRFAAKEELCQIYPMIQWSFAYRKARKGPWEEYARDRARFSNRIKGMENILAPAFNSKHRELVYKQRFQDESTD